MAGVTALNPLRSAYSSLPPPPRLTTTDLLTVPVILPFPQLQLQLYDTAGTRGLTPACMVRKGPGRSRMSAGSGRVSKSGGRGGGGWPSGRPVLAGRWGRREGEGLSSSFGVLRLAL